MPYDTPTKDLIKESGQLSIHQLTAIHTLLTVHKTVTTKKPAYLADKLVLKKLSNDRIFPQKQIDTFTVLNAINQWNYLIPIVFNNNSFNITRLPFDNDAQPTLGKPSSYFDIGLTGGLSSAFSVGSTKTKTYEFWVKLDLSDSRQSTLFYSDVSKSNQFVSNNNISKKQHIYILNNRVYCDIYNANSTSTSYFSEKKEITSNSVHHILVSVDMNLSQSKVKIFVDGFRVPSVSTAALIPPGSITAKIWPLERPSISNVFKFQLWATL